ncbi:MAG: hypothetical protein ACI845_004092 [Gammaproteobacteria bacterium]|jgi:hypothetical protein
MGWWNACIADDVFDHRDGSVFTIEPLVGDSSNV